MAESWSATAARIAAATPGHRDRAADGLRAFAIAGVVLGHWLVTAFVATGDGLGVRSPLAAVPGFAPATWVFQTLAVFFLVGGYTAALGRRTPYRTWLRGRMRRLFRPAAALLGVWAVAAPVLVWGGLDLATLRNVVKLVLSPLWFLVVYAALTAATPAVSWVWARTRWWGLAAVLALVGGVDLARFAADAPARIGWLNIPAGWLVPYYLGVAWAAGGVRGRRVPAVLLVTGATAAVLLVAVCGFPASMVGVPGARVSNLNPPTSAAVAFGLAQTGLALLLRGPLARWLRAPGRWAAVAVLNLSAMTVFLWHQSAMMSVTLLTRPLGVLPGLHSAPAHPGWVAARVVWFPVFGAALLVLCVLFRRFEHGGARGRPARKLKI